MIDKFREWLKGNYVAVIIVAAIAILVIIIGIYFQSQAKNPVAPPATDQTVAKPPPPPPQKPQLPVTQNTTLPEAPQAKSSEWKNKYLALDARFTSLERDYSNLLAENAQFRVNQRPQLEAQYNELHTKYQLLVTKANWVETEYYPLLDAYNKLVIDFDTLMIKHGECDEQ